MSQRMIHRCDACGVEHEDVEHMLNVLATRTSPNWGHFALGGDAGGGAGIIGGYGYAGNLPPMIPAVYDLCEACVAKVVAVLGLKVPPPSSQDDWPVPMGSYATCRPNIVRRAHLQPVPNVELQGAAPELTAEDLKAIGIDVDAYVARGYMSRVARVGDPSCSCHDQYKCVPEMCEGHCDKCRQRALDRVKDIPLGDPEAP